MGMALEMKAEVEGRKARKSGIALINNPYPNKSAEAKLWAKGWQEGTPHPSFQNGCARAEKEIQNKLQNAGVLVENVGMKMENILDPKKAIDEMAHTSERTWEGTIYTIADIRHPDYNGKKVRAVLKNGKVTFEWI